MNKKKKQVLIISILILVLIILIGGTIAFFGWTGEESTVNVTVSSGTGSCTLGTDNEIELEPVSTRNNGRIITLNAKQEMASNAYITWTLKVNEIKGLQDNSFKYLLVNTTTGVTYGEGNFANITSSEGNNTITFSNTEKLSYNKDYVFTLYLWIDGTLGNNSLSMADQEFDFDMVCSITGTD